MNEPKTSPWLIAFRVIFTIALVACIAFIFGNSLENGALSSARSREVMELINKMLAKVRLGPLAEHTIRKLAHFAEFTLLGFLLMMCLRVYTAHFVRHTSWPLLGGMTTALMDETLQKFTAGRTSQVTDVWIDMAGVVAGLFVALLILLVVRLLVALYRADKENQRLREQNEAYEREQRQREQARLASQAIRRSHQNQAPKGDTP